MLFHLAERQSQRRHSMDISRHLEHLAVCSWSLQPAGPADLAQQLSAVGIGRVQLGLDPVREDPAWADAFAVLGEHGIDVVSGMMAAVGEDYSTLESIKVTGGITPDETWEQNLANFTANADLMVKEGVSTALFHAGFLPHEESDPDFEKMLGRLSAVADLFAERGLSVVLETGQEPAHGLRAFLDRLNRGNVGANLDPANMLLYNNGNPVEALRLLGSYVCNLHIKDANVTQVPGTWGEEVVVGTGQVDWSEFFEALDDIGFEGDLCIEREAGDQRVADIRRAREFLASLNEG
jgi:L-ribulose-5-phosphate 3-epimerase